jgi:hypothetical protein
MLLRTGRHVKRFFRLSVEILTIRRNRKLKKPYTLNWGRPLQDPHSRAEPSGPDFASTALCSASPNPPCRFALKAQGPVRPEPSKKAGPSRRRLGARLPAQSHDGRPAGSAGHFAGSASIAPPTASPATTPPADAHEAAPAGTNAPPLQLQSRPLPRRSLPHARIHTGTLTLALTHSHSLLGASKRPEIARKTRQNMPFCGHQPLF